MKHVSNVFVCAHEFYIHARSLAAVCSFPVCECCNGAFQQLIQMVCNTADCHYFCSKANMLEERCLHVVHVIILINGQNSPLKQKQN